MLKVCCGTVPGKLPNKFTMSKKTKTKKKTYMELIMLCKCQNVFVSHALYNIGAIT